MKLQGQRTKKRKSRNSSVSTSSHRDIISHLLVRIPCMYLSYGPAANAPYSYPYATNNKIINVFSSKATLSHWSEVVFL